MMDVNILFASTREQIGTNRITLKLPDGYSVQDLKLVLVNKYPHAERALATCLVAVDRCYVSVDQLLTDGSEVAFFPPVSGG
jgi:molybdopterin converting factor subunit 1